MTAFQFHHIHGKKINDDFYLVNYNSAAKNITDGYFTKLIGSKLSDIYKNNPDILNDFYSCYKNGTSIEKEYIYKYKTLNMTKYLSVKYASVDDDLILVQTEDITRKKTLMKRPYLKVRKNLNFLLKYHL